MIWNNVTLGEISANIQTGPFGSQLHQSDYSDVGTPVVMPKDMIGGKILENSIARVSSEHVDRLSRHKVEVGDILYSRRGDVGRCAFTTEHEKGWLCGTGCLRVSIDKEKAEPKFVFYQLQKAETVGWVVNHAVGSTMLNLNTSILSAIPIQVPELDTQRKIINILTAYDDLIENNKKQIKLLEEMAQRLYKEWFVNLRFPGYEDVPVVDGVPDGWTESSLEELASVLRRGISPKYSDEGIYQVINQKCIRQTMMDIGEARRQEKTYQADLNLLDNDVVICSTGIGTLGRVGQVFGSYPNTTFDSHVTLVRAKESVGAQFLFQTIKYNQAYLMGMGKGSTNQQELYRDVIKSVKVVCPAEVVMKQFELLAQPIHDKMKAIRDEIVYLKSARDMLLPKLMSGEIEV